MNLVKPQRLSSYAYRMNYANDSSRHIKVRKVSKV